MTKNIETQLKSIAKSLNEVVHLLKGDRPGVLKEPGRIEFDSENIDAIVDAVTGVYSIEEKENND